ncbi:helix-turn-helix domain-containing protein, partial [Bifidobacterium longum]
MPLTWKTSTRSHGPLSIEQTQARRAEYVRLLDEEGMNFTQAAHAVGVSKRTGKAWRNGRTHAT